MPKISSRIPNTELEWNRRSVNKYLESVQQDTPTLIDILDSYAFRLRDIENRVAKLEALIGEKNE